MKTQFASRIRRAVCATAIFGPILFYPCHDAHATSTDKTLVSKTSPSMSVKDKGIVRRQRTISDKSSALPAALSQLIQQKNWQKALPLAHETVTKFQQQFGETDLRTIHAQLALADTLGGLKQFKEAETILHTAIRSQNSQTAGSTEPTDPRRRTLIKSYESLAWLLDTQGQFDDAVAYYERALSLRAESSGWTKIDTQIACYNLASLYHDAEKFEPAQRRYQRVLEAIEQVSEKNKPSTDMMELRAIIHYELGDIAFRQERFQDAKQTLDNSIQYWKMLPYANRPRMEYANMLHLMARTEEQLSLLTTAEKNYVEAMNLMERLLGKSNPELSEILYNASMLYRKLNQLDKANALETRAEKLLGIE